jgi:uncharacterized protein (DUF362 family)
MACRYTRREILHHTAAALGAVTVGSTDRLWAAMSPKVAAPSAPSLPVAIQRCATYERQSLRDRLNTALDLIGGMEPLVRGKTVTIKLNLTGGPRRQLGGLPASRTYHVHPHFVAATCAAIHEAGARRIVLVESSYDVRPLPDVMAEGGWDIDMINAAGGGTVSWEDTRNQGKWSGYSRFTVPWGGFVYPAFDLNRCYEKTDVFVSLGKLKDHANAGITVCVKNLFGIAPTSIYGDNFDAAGNPSVDEQTVSARGKTFHKGERQPPAGAPQECDPESPREWSYRVPGVTADLYGARLPDLCLVDGIETNRGGEGPWIKGVQPIQPHVLLAGRNGVCTDAVSAAVMGYDPTADHGQFPFMGNNHLKLLAEKGVGTHDVRQIEVLGTPIREALHPFNPKRLKVGAPIFQ